MFNIPPLFTGMLLISWLEWFAQANSFDSFSAFRKMYFESIGEKGYVFSAGKSVLYPYLYGQDAAIDFVLNLLCSQKSDINIQRIIRCNTIFPLLSSFYSCVQQRQFWSINNLKGNINQDDVVKEYNSFCRFQGLENILSTKSDFLYRMQIQEAATIRYCPECIKNDIKTHGFPFGKVWHNFPYVCKCAIHNKDLVVFSSGIPDLTSEHKTANLYPGPENLQYSLFVYNLFMYLYNNNLSVDLSTFTSAVYRFQKKLKLSSWRLLTSILYEGYIDSSFPGLEVRSPSKEFTDHYHEDETLNYYMYEPQNMICVLVHLFGSFKQFEPFLWDRSHEPSDHLAKEYFKRHSSDLSPLSLRNLNKEELNKIFSEKTEGNCSITHIDEHDTCFVRYKEIPSCKQFCKKPTPSGIARIPLADVIADLSQKRTYMFLPVRESSLKYSPIIEKQKQITAFKEYCNSILESFISSDSNKADIRPLLLHLPRCSFGLLSKKECMNILISVANDYKETELRDGKINVIYKKDRKAAESA